MPPRLVQRAFACAAALSLLGESVLCAAPYPDRWVYVARNLTRDEHVADIRRIVAAAADHGLNGMVLAGGIEEAARWDAKRRQRLQQVIDICRARHVEIIPMVWSVGYGSGLSVDPNLAAGIPCRDVPFVVHNGVAALDVETGPSFTNGGFEQFNGHRAEGFDFHDKPGQVSFIDTEVRHGGKASLRFEHFGDFEHGHGRVMQTLSVAPHRQYRVTCWVRTESLTPASAFKLQVYGGGGPIAPLSFNLPATTDWRPVSLLFNSLDNDKVRVYAGVWGGQAGRFWLDDFTVQPLALVNVLRRSGTPVSVRDSDGGECVEGKDYARIVDDRLSFRHPRDDSPVIRLLPGSRIREGQRLRVSYYHGMAINRGQVTVCMSEPELYAHWKRSAAALAEILGPRKWFLSMDEIRAGGSCQACKDRGMTMAQILGDCITRQVDIIRGVAPQARVYIWSDMLDPNHNAHGNYYLVEGDFTGSWKYAPKDLVIACWYYRKREASMKFFSGHGFETLAGAYYDGDTLENVRGWLATAGATLGCRGIMYTTWRNKYELLPAFGDLVAKPPAR